jgi:hypothetical protein
MARPAAGVFARSPLQTKGSTARCDREFEMQHVSTRARLLAIKLVSIIGPVQVIIDSKVIVLCNTAGRHDDHT